MNPRYKMKSLKLKTYLIWFLLVVGALSVIGYNLIPRRAKITEELIEEEGKFRLGKVNINTENGEMHFKGKVQKNKDWVQHLVYLHGYKWLKEESAIISEVKLSDLQKAIALLDWRLWDELWYRKNQKSPPEADPHSAGKVKSQELSVFVKWDEEEVAVQELVLTEDKLEIGDFIFLGSPYFDHIALEASPGVDCRLCPIFHLEEKVLRELFIRESGQSGYELNSERIPPQGTEVTIIIRLSK